MRDGAGRDGGRGRGGDPATLISTTMRVLGTCSSQPEAAAEQVVHSQRAIRHAQRQALSPRHRARHIAPATPAAAAAAAAAADSGEAPQEQSSWSAGGCAMGTTAAAAAATIGKPSLLPSQLLLTLWAHPLLLLKLLAWREAPEVAAARSHRQAGLRGEQPQVDELAWVLQGREGRREERTKESEPASGVSSRVCGPCVSVKRRAMARLLSAAQKERKKESLLPAAAWRTRRKAT